MTEPFKNRHIGPNDLETNAMLESLGLKSLEDLIDQTVPASIRMNGELNLPTPLSEDELLVKAKEFASENQILKTMTGLGYYGTITPTVILRNILENPGWYTAYTPYQPEISQGRLEALLNFQTMVTDLTGMEISNASLLDEGTAAAEAMAMCFAARTRKNDANAYFVANGVFDHTVDILKTRAEPLGIKLIFGDPRTLDFKEKVFGAILQVPNQDGEIFELKEFIDRVHADASLVTVIADLMSLALMKAPGEVGADVVVGSTQRFGVPMGFGGPHAAFFATKNEFKRLIPGRIVGVTKDTEGKHALRLALQTREQHIRRDRATSNICTSQVLLAVMAGMYAAYHGPQGIQKIAARMSKLASVFAEGMHQLGFKLKTENFFDTVQVAVTESSVAVLKRACQKGYNLRQTDANTVGLSFDETSTAKDVKQLWEIFTNTTVSLTVDQIDKTTNIPAPLKRGSNYLTHPSFNTHHSETEMLRYLNRLQKKDITLTQSMIPLGSCTMKLNATTEMIPVTWPEFGNLHPFAPLEQAKGYEKLIHELESSLEEITGFDAISLQPNAGSQGEYAGLLVIRAFHKKRGEGERNICLIPKSAHGTNPASAVMCGMKVVVINCDDEGNIDIADLKVKATEHSKDLAALMVTYPSTHGVFEEGIQEICKTIHDNGGQVYMDGANLNALVGLCKPGEFGPDLAHLNLHKTFCIPHGGGGPGVGPIGVKKHLATYLPGHRHTKKSDLTISAAPWGSAGILPISWAYLAMMGADGLKKATQVAILNANYIAKRLEEFYPVLYKGKNGRVAHECIIDCRTFKKTADVSVEDIAKRLMDFGFHAPTMSWPVAGTLMIEPTESESKEELDRFCDAMIAIRKEISKVEKRDLPIDDNPLKNAPHSERIVAKETWSHPYTREQAFFPLPWVIDNKFWVPVGRVDNAYGDKNLVCACPSIESYS